MKIKTYLKKSKLTREQFSEMVGISRAALEKYIYDERVPSLENAYKIVTGTDKGIDYIDLLQPPKKLIKKKLAKLDKL